jgi:uncharacterized surface protein with fasciclin (FAS1) repeats
MPLIPDVELKDLTQTLEANGRFKRLLEAAKRTDLLQEVEAGGPFTILAPTDEAFARLGTGTVEQLSPDALRDLLLYHAIRGRLVAADAVQQGSVRTISEVEVPFRQEEGKVFAGNAEIIEPNVNCSNGVVHVLDRVLIPPGFKAPAADTPGKVQAESPPPSGVASPPKSGETQ